MLLDRSKTENAVRYPGGELKVRADGCGLMTNVGFLRGSRCPALGESRRFESLHLSGLPRVRIFHSDDQFADATLPNF